MSEVMLIQIAALVILSSFLLRGFVCGVTFLSIYVEIGKKEGITLVRELEIPGVEIYFKRELIFWTLPIFSLIAFNIIDPFDRNTLSETGLITLVLFLTISMTWGILDLFRTVIVYRNLRKIKNSTATLRKVAGKTVDGLRLLVGLKTGMKRKILKESTKMVSKMSTKKLESDIEKGIEPSKGRTIATRSLEVVTKVITAPERLVDKILELGQDRMDHELSKHFVKFEDTNTTKLIILCVWSLVPMIALFVARYLS